MLEFLQQDFLGNPVQEWLVSLGIGVGAIILGRLVYWFIGKFVKALASRTKTKLDDIIIDMAEEPLVFAISIIGVWVGLQRLQLGGGATAFIDQVYFMLIDFTVAWLLVRLYGAISKEYIVPYVKNTDSDLDDQLLPIANVIVKVTIWTVALIVGLDHAGYDVRTVLAGLGIGGFAFAFAAKETLANFIGWIMILADKPLSLYDWIVYDGSFAKIEEIGLRSTRIRTLRGTLVSVPNFKVVDNAVDNVSQGPGFQVDLHINLSLENTPELCKAATDICKAIAVETDHVFEKSMVSLNDFNDYAVHLRFRYIILVESAAHYHDTRTEVVLAIMRRFRDEGIKFAIPMRKNFLDELPESRAYL